MFWKMVQLAGMMLLLAGVALELYTRQDFYFTLITIGSLVFALGTKLTHYKRQNKKNIVPRETTEIKGDLNVGLEQSPDHKRPRQPRN